MHVKPNVAEFEIPLTRDEVSAILRTDVRTVDRYVKAGKIECIKFGGRVRFTAKAVNTFIDNHILKIENTQMTANQ